MRVLMVCEESENEIENGSLWTLILGVLFIMVACMISSLGENLQKYSFLCEAKFVETDKRIYCCQPRWVAGLMLVWLGNIGVLIALGFAPQSLVTPVGGGFTMVANVFYAHFLLKEPFQRRDAIATAVIISGVILVTLFADKSAECYTLTELVGLYSRVAFIIYVAIVSVLCIFLMRLVKHVEHIQDSFGSSSDQYSKYSRIHPILYPAIAGLFGAQSVLFAKSTSELVKVTLAGGVNQWKYFGTYFIFISMMVCIFSQIHWLAQGLQRFDAVFTIPVFQCTTITITIAAGGVYFDEFKNLSVFHTLMFAIGVIVTMTGVILMSLRKMNESKPQQECEAIPDGEKFLNRILKAPGVDYQMVEMVDSGIMVDCEL